MRSSLFMMNIQVMKKKISESIQIESFNNQPVYASHDEKLPDQSTVFSSPSKVNKQIEEHHEAVHYIFFSIKGQQAD